MKIAVISRQYWCCSAMRSFCLAPNPRSTSGFTEVTAKPPARHIKMNTPTLTPIKIIVKGFERVKSARRKRSSLAVSRAATSASESAAPQKTQATLAAGVGFPQAGHSLNRGSLLMGFKVIGRSLPLDSEIKIRKAIEVVDGGYRSSRSNSCAALDSQ